MSEIGLQLAPIGPCGKRTFKAKRIAAKLARRVNESGKEHTQPYHCTQCHGWHMGTSDFYRQVREHKRTRQKAAIIDAD